MNEKAPEGKIWMCGACGKKAFWLYGFDPNDKDCCDSGYDESCMLNAVLVDDNRPKIISEKKS